MFLFWSVPINFCQRLRCRFIAWSAFFPLFIDSFFTKTLGCVEKNKYINKKLSNLRSVSISMRLSCQRQAALTHRGFSINDTLCSLSKSDSLTIISCRNLATFLTHNATLPRQLRGFVGKRKPKLPNSKNFEAEARNVSRLKTSVCLSKFIALIPTHRTQPLLCGSIQL